MELSVIIPAHNEQERLGPTLERLAYYLGKMGRSYEILVVDDASTDGTSALAEDYAKRGFPLRVLHTDAVHGKGAAVKTGMLAAAGDKLLFSDADLSTPIEELEKLERALESGAQVAIGSRGMPESDLRVRQPFYREAMGRIFNKVVQMMAVPGISDTQCGFKLFRRQEGKRLFQAQTLPGFAFDVELLYLARKWSYRVAEVPVTWINSPQSKVSAIRDSLRMLRDLIKIRWRGLRGYYR